MNTFLTLTVGLFSERYSQEKQGLSTVFFMFLTKKTLNNIDGLQTIKKNE
jgi:hypothetical protein